MTGKHFLLRSIRGRESHSNAKFTSKQSDRQSKALPLRQTMQLVALTGVFRWVAGHLVDVLVVRLRHGSSRFEDRDGRQD